MKSLIILVAAFLTFFGAGQTVAAPAFYGNWSCAQVVDNTVVTTDWSRESYSDAGVAVGPEGKTTPLKVRMIRKGLYDLAYADGGRARIAMKEPWMFVRGTMDHSYLCLRAAP